jgi:CHAT domain-containing protein
MEKELQALLECESVEERRRKILAIAPTKHECLVEALRAESYRRERSNPHSALVVAEVLADLAALWRDEPTRALAQLIEANTQRALADHVTALALYQQASQIYRSLQLDLEATRALVGQLDTMMYLGRYNEALRIADQAIHHLRAAGDDLTLGKTVANRGNILARLGQYELALSNYTEARTIFARLDAGHHLAVVAANAANVFTNLNDFRQAEQMYEQARAHFAAAEMINAVAQVDHNLAYLYFAQGDYTKALITFDQARSVFAAQKSQVDLAYVDLYRSEIYLALNLWREALELARAARPPFAAADMHWEEAQLWLVEASALAHMEHAAQAHEALAHARQIFVQENNPLWVAITDLYQAMFDLHDRNLARASEYASVARAAFDAMHHLNRAAECEIVLGEIALSSQSTKEAHNHLTRGISLLEGADLPAITFACHYGLGRVQQAMGNLQLAQEYFQRALSNIERLQAAIGAEDYKIAFRSDKLPIYEAYIALCLSLKEPEAEQLAFETLERSKARALLDTLAHRPAPVAAAPVEASLMAEIADLKRELNWLYNRLYQPDPSGAVQSPAQAIQYRTEIAQHEHLLSSLLNYLRSPDLHTVASNPISTANLAQIQDVLPQDTLLLEYYLTDDELIVFGLTHRQMWTVRTATGRDCVAEGLGQLRFQFTKFNYGPAYRQRHAAALRQGALDCLQQLYAALIQPIAERLDAETLLIVPHDLLHYVPFHALHDGEQYLLQTRSVAYAPSATILHRLLLSQADAPLGPPLILGAVDATLPFIRAEAEMLAGLFPQADLRLGDGATINSLAAIDERPAFMHIATHGTFRSDNPLFSALKLADGWLTVNDIYTLTQCAPLVTLSACETGRSQVQSGDELLGLCRGFLGAGARSLVVSQWIVDDHSTGQLMAHFYQNLRAGKPVHQALRQAQLACLANFEHPYYWAPFLAIGDPWQRLSLT